MTEGAPRRSLRATLLRRLPLLVVVGVAAWVIAANHSSHVTLRYRFGDGGPFTALKTEVLQNGVLVRSAEWHYTGAGPAEQLQRLELHPGDYTVAAHALGRAGPDPRPLPFHVGEGEDQPEVEVDLP